MNISHVEADKITRITHRIAAMAPPCKWRKNSGRGVKGSALREIRKVATSSEDEDFRGFKEDDTEDNKVLTDRKVIVLHIEQSFMDEYELAGPSTDNSGNLVIITYLKVLVFIYVTFKIKLKYNFCFITLFF